MLCAGGGWFLDGDVVWLRAPPALKVGEPAHVGHFFATMAARRDARP